MNCAKQNGEQILNKVKTFTKNRDFINNIGLERLYELLNNFLDVIDDDIKNMKENRIRELSPGRIDKFEKIYSFLENFLFEQKVCPDFTQYITDLNFVVYNWYANLENTNKLQHNIPQMIQRIEILISEHTILKELLLLLSDQIRRMKELIRFEPPAFKLSKHYLDALIKNRS